MVVKLLIVSGGVESPLLGVETTRYAGFQRCVVRTLHHRGYDMHVFAEIS